jgi:hypothetical protein
MLQVLLAVQLAATLASAHAAVSAAASLAGHAGLLRSISPYRLVASHSTCGLLVLATLLLVAAAGVLPRIVVPLQFWVTASFPLSCPSIANGGDVIAGLLLFLMLPHFVLGSPLSTGLSRWALRVQSA